MLRRELIGLWLPVLAWATLIFAFSAQPATSLPNTGNLVQKGAHVGEYAVLAALLWRALAGRRLGRTAVLGFAWLAAVLYAVSDETHQLFVPGRHGSPLDLVIDGLGAAFGLFLASLFRGVRSP